MSQIDKTLAIVRGQMVERAPVVSGVPFEDVSGVEATRSFSGLLNRLLYPPFYGVGLTGQLAPGTELMVVPLRDVGELASLPVETTEMDAWLNDNKRRVPSMVRLQAGEVIVYPDSFPEPVAFHVLSPWGVPWAAAQRTASYTPFPNPLIRVFRRPGCIPSSLGYTRVPWANYTNLILTDEPIGVVGAFLFPPCVRTVALQFQDNAAGARIQGAETASYEVWWRGLRGLWHHNPADDLEAGALGAIDASHDLEVFDVPGWATGIYVRKMSGNTFWCNATGSEV